eukprot:gene10413-biopygen22812
MKVSPLPEGADEGAVTTAYRERARRTHPDKNTEGAPNPTQSHWGALPEPDGFWSPASSRWTFPAGAPGVVPASLGSSRGVSWSQDFPGREARGFPGAPVELGAPPPPPRGTPQQRRASSRFRRPMIRSATRSRRRRTTTHGGQAVPGMCVQMESVATRGPCLAQQWGTTSPFNSLNTFSGCKPAAGARAQQLLRVGGRQER